MRCVAESTSATHFGMEHLKNVGARAVSKIKQGSDDCVFDGY